MNTNHNPKQNGDHHQPPNKKKVPNLFYAFLVGLVIVFVGGVIELHHVSFYQLGANESPSQIQFFITTLFSLFVLVGISVQAIIYWLQWRQTSQLFDLIERPSLGVEAMAFDSATGICVAQIRNSGKAPARNVTITIVPNHPTLQELGGAVYLPPTAGSPETMKSRSVIPVGGVKMALTLPIAAPVLSEIVTTKTRALFLWVDMKYDGVVDREDPYILTNFARYNAENPIGHFEDCPEYCDAT